MSPPPEAGIRLERDPSLENAPYDFEFNETLYEELLREDLGFTDDALSKLFITATDRRTISPHANGYYNQATRRLVLKPGKIWRNYSFSDVWANEAINSNLRHESKHAAQDLIEGRGPFNRAVIAKSVAVRGLSVALALGEHSLLNSPGFDYSDVAAVGTYLVANHIGQHQVYLSDPKEVEARAFQHDPEVKGRWDGVISLNPAT